MKSLAVVAIFFGVCVATGQQPASSRPVFLMQGLSDLHHPVSTKNPERSNSSIRD